MFSQLEERQRLQEHIRMQRTMAQEDMLQLRGDIERYRTFDRDDGMVRTRETDDDLPVRTRAREERQRRRRSFE